MILGKDERVLYGPGYITDRIGGLEFRISSKSFYQVNPEQTEELYRTALSLAKIKILMLYWMHVVVLEQSLYLQLKRQST